jgi:ribosomal protein L31
MSETKRNKKAMALRLVKLKCRYCNREFAFNSTLYRHEIEVCKKKHIKYPNLKRFGNEDISHINKKTYIEIIKKGKKSIPLLIKKIFCDEKHKENNTIQITSITNKYAKKYNGKIWIDVLKQKLLVELTSKYSIILSKKVVALSKNMEESDMEAYNEYLDALDKPKKEIIINKEIDNQILLYLYNYTKEMKNRPIQNDSSSEDESGSSESEDSSEEE